MSTQKSSFSTDIANIRPPSFVPEIPAPEWVRKSIGHRYVTPSASILPQNDSNDIDQLVTELEKSHLDDKKLAVDVKVLSTLCHIKWTAALKSKNYDLKFCISI
jgi:hypothetical protein